MAVWQFQRNAPFHVRDSDILLFFSLIRKRHKKGNDDASITWSRKRAAAAAAPLVIIIQQQLIGQLRKNVASHHKSSKNKTKKHNTRTAAARKWGRQIDRNHTSVLGRQNVLVHETVMMMKVYFFYFLFLKSYKIKGRKHFLQITRALQSLGGCWLDPTEKKEKKKHKKF